MRFHRHYGDGTDTIRRLSLWDLANASAGDKVTSAAELTLTLLILSCLLLLLIASEPDRFVAAWVLLSLGLTLASLGRLHFAAAELQRGHDRVELTMLPGEVVTIVALIASTGTIAALLLPRGLRACIAARRARAITELRESGG
ncbi:hypothetical protein [Sphaerisporangium perillae]|uniref:hypothetical protein n=1 Tax=Sphaerisporangium perillae TaxID=2935860 RepID=UPI00200EB89C|nr:hypothetical protein [Sphaerisporangium perillae]